MKNEIFTSVDPNDNAGRRHQYRVDNGTPMRRVLPADTDRWMDDAIDDPWWEIMHEAPADGPIGDWLREAGYDPLQWATAVREYYHMVIALTPNGREVRYGPDGGMRVQPENDNYWIPVSDLPGARRAYFGAADAS